MHTRVWRENHGGPHRAQQICSPHAFQEVQKDRERSRVWKSSQKDIPSDRIFFHLSPKSYRFHHISKHQPLGDQDFIPGPLYTFEAPNIAACITFCMFNFPAMLTPPLSNTYYFWIKTLAVILVLFSFLPIFNFYATVPIPISSVSYLLKRLCINISQLHKAIWKLCWI